MPIFVMSLKLLFVIVLVNDSSMIFISFQFSLTKISQWECCRGMMRR